MLINSLVAKSKECTFINSGIVNEHHQSGCKNMVTPKEQNEMKHDAFKIHISVLEKTGVRGICVIT